jgi:UDP-N-acetylglucosamine acyltransferase
MQIHPTAIVDPAARIAETAEIGPFCIIGAEVEVGARTRMMAHVYCEGPLTIGAENTFYPYSSVGVAPQDLKYRGERSYTAIGDRNRIREFVTIHRGTEGGGLHTHIGSDNLLMAYVHVAHDVQVGDRTVLANGVTLGGHVAVGDWAVIGAFSGVHQFCRIGKHSMVGGYSVITQDVLPYATTVSHRENKVFGANRTGLERRGFADADIEALQTTFRLLSRANLNTTQAIERILAEVAPNEHVTAVLEFMAESKRGFIK